VLERLLRHEADVAVWPRACRIRGSMPSACAPTGMVLFAPGGPSPRQARRAPTGRALGPGLVLRERGSITREGLNRRCGCPTYSLAPSSKLQTREGVREAVVAGFASALCSPASSVRTGAFVASLSRIPISTWRICVSLQERRRVALVRASWTKQAGWRSLVPRHKTVKKLLSLAGEAWIRQS